MSDECQNAAMRFMAGEILAHSLSSGGSLKYASRPEFAGLVDMKVGLLSQPAPSFSVCLPLCLMSLRRYILGDVLQGSLLLWFTATLCSDRPPQKRLIWSP